MTELFVNQHGSTLLSQITQAGKHNHTRVQEGERERSFTGKVITFAFIYIVTANVWLVLSA